MIRKDFILQNYVAGTGGRCDARAVRCHERIARWHAMCEHQLAHLTGFTKGQSQQNIQELGQTMKTLNQYYDDPRGRSLVEVDGHDNTTARRAAMEAKEQGIAAGFTPHGSSADTVQGKNPVDYDGTPLINQFDEASGSFRRLLGTKTALDAPNHGTAEPEMRGLYILLTIDNDGGMEVLKYVSRIFRQRPHVYHSKPVQLAMQIYKVWSRSKRHFSVYDILDWLSR